MSFIVKCLTVKNFLSVGNATQAINFNRKDLVLVLGENLDLGGDDSGARNGTGKTTIINALSYAFFGTALNQIKRDNLVNKTNAKGMMVTVEFEHDGKHYRIERGRKPTLFRFFVDDIQQGGELTNDQDDAQGDSRETQAAIERLLNMSHDMFKNVVALNTYSEPFLAMKSNDQRSIIEQLLGITLLSEKADALKEMAKTTRDMILAEEIRIKAVTEANTRVQEQINSLISRQKLWLRKKDEDIEKLSLSLKTLSTINIDDELAAHGLVETYNTKIKALRECDTTISNLQALITKESKRQNDIQNDLNSLAEHKCYACGGELHDSKQEEIQAAKQQTLMGIMNQITIHNSELLAAKNKKEAIGEIGKQPKTVYASVNEAYDHKNKLALVQHQLDQRINEEDPYKEQIEEMQHRAIEEINYEQINGLNRLKEHQEFLLKLLTNKDSFIRKKIIDQNLSYLNVRLGHYLDNMGLPHTVVFNNDLTVSITELGRDLDFDNLSRGERTRLILGLSWAFRDVWESLYQPINLLFIDELIDNGLDTSGVESAMAVLKKMSRDRHKSIWLVSHKDELISRVNNVLHVIKSGGFTEYSSDVEVNELNNK